MPDFLHYLFGGMAFLLSPRYRHRKRAYWVEKGRMFKIYEIGMWASIPTAVIWLLIAVSFIPPAG